MLASLPKRRQHQPHQTSYSQIIPPQQQPQLWPSTTTTTLHTPITTPQPHYNTPSFLFSFGQDQPLFDFQSQSQYTSSPPQPLMQSENSHHSWLDNGQLTPRSTTRTHQRESSLSSLGSAGPSSPYTANTSNPYIVGDSYHEFQDYHHTTSKPLTPAHTPLQEHFITPHYSSVYHNSNLAYTMSQDVPSTSNGDAVLRPSPDIQTSVRPTAARMVSIESPDTPPHDEERQKRAAYRTSAPKLDRTMTDVYADELYYPNLYVSSAEPAAPSTSVVSPQNDVFSQRLQAANSQHLSASNPNAPMTVTSRQRSPFRDGSELAPAGNTSAPSSPNVRFGTAMHMREQQKAENDAKALQQQFDRTSPGHSTPATISPKDVDLVYHENEEDANAPLFPQQKQSPSYRPVKVEAPAMKIENDEHAGLSSSQQSFASMATSRRESSGYSNSSLAQSNGNNGNFNFTPPAVSGAPRVPQQYPFVPQNRREPSSLSTATGEFPAILTSMESSSSEYMGDTSENKKPSDTSAGSGTYSCTYHNCTLRFDTPAKLQKHKREGHRGSATASGGSDETNARNTQAGPHKCERVNPSTGRACNVIFSRPYDLTRHEDTIHNARKQKVYCPICTEEKSFSRNDALTRHLRVVHPEVDAGKGRRRGNH